MLEKLKCPEQDSNPQHPDFLKGALTTELPRQPQWSESNISYKAYKVELSSTSQASRQSMPGTDYDLVINVHICCNCVPGCVGGYVPGMLVVCKNQTLNQKTNIVNKNPQPYLAKLNSKFSRILGYHNWALNNLALIYFISDFFFQNIFSSFPNENLFQSPAMVLS